MKLKVKLLSLQTDLLFTFFILQTICFGNKFKHLIKIIQTNIILNCLGCVFRDLQILAHIFSLHNRRLGRLGEREARQLACALALTLMRLLCKLIFIERCFSR